MKTQVNDIVNGSKISIGETSMVGGTNMILRKERFEKIMTENPESITVVIDGFQMELNHFVSTTGKTHWYKGIAPLEFWKKHMGVTCISKYREDVCLVTMNSDCTFVAQILTSKAPFYANIQNDLITIL